MTDADLHGLRGCRRINVIGTSGSGKTTFARRLAGLLDVPCIEMDALFWGPGWSEASDDELTRRLRAEISEPAWVLDGNYTRTTSVKWAEVDAVIWLDFPFLTTVKRVAGRAMKRIVDRKELWPGTGNRETIRMSFFSTRSVILWSIRTHGRNRRKYERLVRDDRYAGIRFIRLQRDSEVERLIESLRGAA